MSREEIKDIPSKYRPQFMRFRDDPLKEMHSDAICRQDEHQEYHKEKEEWGEVG